MNLPLGINSIIKDKSRTLTCDFGHAFYIKIEHAYKPSCHQLGEQVHVNDCIINQSTTTTTTNESNWLIKQYKSIISAILLFNQSIINQLIN